MKYIKTHLLIITLLIFTKISFAQPLAFEIRSVNKGGGNIAVEMRATAGTAPATANFVTDIVFGLKWLASYNVDLLPVINTTYNIKKSGARTLSSSYHFQAFYADNTPYNIPANWTLNNWVEIMNISNTLNSSGVGIFEICQPGFDATTDPNIGIDLTDFTPVINGAALNVPIPLTLLDFRVTPLDNAISLFWKVTNEPDCDAYDIERSDNNQSGFIKIGSKNCTTIQAVDNTYTYADNSVQKNKLYYYRLKQVERGGNYTYSEIKYARINASSPIKLSPNPAKEVLTISFPADIEVGDYVIRVNDLNGQTLYEVKKVINANQVLSIKVSAIPAGAYFVDISKDQIPVYSEKFVKL